MEIKSFVVYLFYISITYNFKTTMAQYLLDNQTEKVVSVD